MEEIKWYENSSLDSIKNIIKNNINIVSRSFLAIGYYLKNVRDRKLYLQDGYKDIWEFANSEFGISQSWASRYMSINDRFSKGGNSPIIQDEYKDFSSSKLSEMLALTDGQLEEVTLTTTRAEIRDLKSYAHAHKTESEEKEFAPAQVEVDCYDKLAAYWCKRTMTVELYELAKSQNDEDIDVFNQYFNERYMRSECYAPAYDNTPGYEISFKTNKNGIYFDDEEKTVYSWQLLIDLVCQEAENDTPASKPINFHENDNGLKRLREIRREIKAKSKEPENVTETAEIIIEPELTERECTNCKYNTMSRDEYFQDYPEKELFPCDDCNDKFNNWLPCTVIPNQDEVDSFDQESEFVDADVIHEGIVLDCYNEEEGWHKELILSEPEQPETKEYSLQYFLKEQKNKLDDMVKVGGIPELPFQRQKAIVQALETLIESQIDKSDQVEQPDLPILKNNDQRKEFIDNYITWPVWIDQVETGEKFYRYNLTDVVAIVVKVSKKHEYKNYKETKDFEYAAEQYYLLGVKSEWSQKGSKYVEDDTRTFYECNTNKSALTEYLKEFQKKGV